MQTDYKISWQRSTEKGIEALARFYEGETKAKKDQANQASVTRYRRGRLIREQVMQFTDGADIAKELKTELGKDKARSIIPEQA